MRSFSWFGWSGGRCLVALLSQWSMSYSLLWAAEGSFVFSDGMHLAGQDYLSWSNTGPSV